MADQLGTLSRRSPTSSCSTGSARRLLVWLKTKLVLKSGKIVVDKR
jgi:hypothetical protein